MRISTICLLGFLILTIFSSCYGHVISEGMMKRQTGSLQPNGLLQPSQFLDPSFQGTSSSNQAQGSPSSGNSTSSSSPSSGSQQFMPSFLDPSKFGTFGHFGQQQPGSGGAQNGSGSTGGFSSSGGSFGPNMFINPNGGQQNSGGNFNIFDPSSFLQG